MQGDHAKFDLSEPDKWLHLNALKIGVPWYLDGGSGAVVRNERVIGTHGSSCIARYWVLAKVDSVDWAQSIDEFRVVMHRGMIIPIKHRGAEKADRREIMYCGALIALLNDASMIAEVANVLPIARGSDDEFSRNIAVAGMIRASLTGDDALLDAQAKIFLESADVRSYRLPAKPLVRAFVSRDTKKFEKHMRAGVEKHWEINRKMKYRVFFEENGRQMLNLSNLHPNFFWPWPEAAFARLLMRETDWRPSFKSEWLPEKILDPEFGRS